MNTEEFKSKIIMMRYKKRTPGNIANEIEEVSWNIALEIAFGCEIRPEEIKTLRNLVEELIKKIPTIKKSID